MVERVRKMVIHTSVCVHQTMKGKTVNKKRVSWLLVITTATSVTTTTTSTTSTTTTARNGDINKNTKML